MKLTVAATALLALPLATGAFGFAPMAATRSAVSSTRLAAWGSKTAIVTGPKGKPAATADEDIMMTLKLIMDHQARSATTSKDQYISQVKEAKKVEEAEKKPETKAKVVVDLSIPYDAAAKLAHEASDKSMAYDAFKTKFEADAVADVISKRPVDLSIPYDASAKLAYETSDKSMAYDAFKTKFEADAVADVISKRPVDLSIPYDASAKLAYEASDKSVAYNAFKTKFEADAVADVISKKQPKEE
jgi:hypothetical protein